MALPWPCRGHGGKSRGSTKMGVNLICCEGLQGPTLSKRAEELCDAPASQRRRAGAGPASTRPPPPMRRELSATSSCQKCLGESPAPAPEALPRAAMLQDPWPSAPTPPPPGMPAKMHTGSRRNGLFGSLRCKRAFLAAQGAVVRCQPRHRSNCRFGNANVGSDLLLMLS